MVRRPGSHNHTSVNFRPPLIFLIVRNGVQQVPHMTFFSNGMCTETLPILCSLEQ